MGDKAKLKLSCCLMQLIFGPFAEWFSSSIASGRTGHHAAVVEAGDLDVGEADLGEPHHLQSEIDDLQR